MTTTHAGDLDPAIAAERESIEAEIAGGTLLTAFAETAERHGGTEAYRWCQDGEWRTLTYTGLRDQVRDTALGLAAAGLRPSDFAVIWSRNRPEANIASMAVMHARGVPVFLYNTLAPSQAAYIAGHCEATVAIVEDRGFLARLEAVRAQLPRLRPVVLEMVMIRPPSARRSQASCRPWNTPLTFTAKLRSNSASVISPNGLVIATAALFTRMSQRPSPASICSTIAWYSARMLTSAAAAIAVPPAVVISATTLPAGSGMWL
jgi:acyl-CoA synthetase (AMP-forming)/AMP-acid ligase II